MPRLIVGLGTGRCGTRSLAAALRAAGVEAEHERKPVLSWAGEPHPGRHLQTGLTAPAWADVGFYYLPHVGRLRGEFPGARFVCLKRDREETVASFVRAKPESADWFGPGRGGWDRAFPDYPGLAFADQVRRYWDEYYAEAGRLRGPDFRVYPTEALNDPARLREMLVYLGVESPAVAPGIRLTD